MAQFRHLLFVVLPALAAGFSLNVKPKEPPQYSQGVSAVGRVVPSDVSCFPAEDCGDSPEPDSTKVGRQSFDAITGRQLHSTWASEQHCEDKNDCCPDFGGASDDGGSWSGESQGPGTYANKRVHCDAGCDTSCDDHGDYSCNDSCGPHLALPLQSPASSPPPLEPIRAPVQATVATAAV